MEAGVPLGAAQPAPRSQARKAGVQGARVCRALGVRDARGQGGWAVGSERRGPQQAGRQPDSRQHCSEHTRGLSEGVAAPGGEGKARVWTVPRNDPVPFAFRAQ